MACLKMVKYEGLTSTIIKFKKKKGKEKKNTNLSTRFPIYTEANQIDQLVILELRYM